MYDVSTYSVSSDRMSGSSLELRRLGFSYMLYVCTLAIRTSMQHANAMLKKARPLFNLCHQQKENGCVFWQLDVDSIPYISCQPCWHFVPSTVRRRLTWRLSLPVLLTCLTGKGCDLHRLISSTFRPSVFQLSVVARFRLLVLRSGTVYQMMSPPLRPCPPSGAVWRLTYSAALTTLTNSAYYTLTIVLALLLRPL